MSRRVVLAGAALVVVLATAGCGAADPGITVAASTALQREVVQVARLTAQHRYPAAQRSLTALQADLRASVASGAVSADRAARIRTAVGLVAADLRAGTPAPTPRPTPTATPTPTPTPAAAPVKVSVPRPAPTKASAPPAPVKLTWPKWIKGHGKKGKGGKGRGG